MFLVLVFTSCSVLPVGTGSTTSPTVGDDSKTPYATDDELRQIVNNSSHLHYKIARSFVFEEMIDLQLDDTYKLSKKPVVIYQLDGTPLYYEYRVVKDGIAYQSFAIAVNKSQGFGIVASQDQANDYSSPHQSARVVAMMYPSRYGVTSQTSMRSTRLADMPLYVPALGRSVEPVEFFENSGFAEMFNPKSRNFVDPNYFLSLDMDDPDYWNIMESSFDGSTNESGENMYVAAKQNYQDLKTHNMGLHNSIDEEMLQIMNMNDEEMEEFLKEELKADNPTTRWSDPRGRIQASKIYNDAMNDINTPTNSIWRLLQAYTYNDEWDFDGSGWGWNRPWCGPFALAMIIMGRDYKSNWPGAFWNFRAVFDKFNEANKEVGGVPMYYSEINNGLKDNNYGYADYGNGAIWWDSTADKMYDHMKSGDPLFIHVPGHWVFAFEADYKSKKRWWSKHLKYEHRFRVTDNGAKSWLRESNGSWWISENSSSLIWIHPLVIYPKAD